jgi:hypothetical protein
VPVISSRARYRVGDLVTFQYGPYRAVARVVEDRGPLGVNGSHVYRVAQFTGEEESDEFELPEHAIEPRALNREEKMDYLAGGALLDILRRGSGGRNPPRVWLSFTPQGRISHTFIEPNGVFGGEVIPPRMLTEEEKTIFEPKRGEVAAFVRSFGLSQADADEVVRRVGVA